MTIKRIYLVHHTHMDVGYTDQPGEVLKIQSEFLDRALTYCEKNPNYRWTIESAYLFKDFCRRRTAAERERLIDCLQNGRMELMAFETQPLTELLDEKGLFDSVAYAAGIGSENGFPVSCAMLDDIGGWCARLPEAMMAKQVRYLVAGVGAFQAFLPWARLPHLFYHRYKESEILVWNLGRDRDLRPQDQQDMIAIYGMGAYYLVLPFLKHFKFHTDRKVELESVHAAGEGAPERLLLELLARLERENYPYEELLLQYGGDNRWPNPNLPELVDKINQYGGLPIVELTTPRHFFEAVEGKYAGQIPVLSGHLADPWISRITPSPRPLAVFLEAQQICCQAETLARENGMDAECETLLAQANEALSLYADHTCGLSCWHVPQLRNPGFSLGDAATWPLRRSHQAKAHYAETALNLSSKVLERLAGKHFYPRQDRIYVRNFSMEPVENGVAEFYIGRDEGELLALLDENGQAFPFQMIGYQRYMVEIPRLLANETRAFQLRRGDPADLCTAPAEPELPIPERWENDFFSLSFDQNTGAICRFQTASKQTENVAKSRSGFLEPVLELPQDYRLDWAMSGMRPVAKSTMESPVFTRATLAYDGEIASILVRKGFFKGGIEFELRYILFKNQPRIDTVLYVDKPETLELQSLYFAVELTGNKPEWTLHGNSASFNPAAELLPGSMLDLFYAPRGVTLKTAERTCELFSPHAPVVHPGRPTNFQWLTSRDWATESPSVFFQLYHNLLVTDSPAFQTVRSPFRFSLRMNGKGKPEQMKLLAVL